MNTRPKLIQNGLCSCCSRDVYVCDCRVAEIHNWLEDQYMLPMAPVEFGAGNPIPVVGDPGIVADDEDEDQVITIAGGQATISERRAS